MWALEVRAEINGQRGLVRKWCGGWGGEETIYARYIREECSEK